MNNAAARVVQETPETQRWLNRIAIRKVKDLIKYLDVGPQAQLPPPYTEDISALLTMVLS